MLLSMFGQAPMNMNQLKQLLHNDNLEAMVPYVYMHEDHYLIMVTETDSQVTIQLVFQARQFPRSLAFAQLMVSVKKKSTCGHVHDPARARPSIRTRTLFSASRAPWAGSALLCKVFSKIVRQPIVDSMFGKSVSQSRPRSKPICWEPTNPF